MPFYIEESGAVPLAPVLAAVQERIMNRTTYFGIPTFKNPMDLWVYQEILFERKPNVILEIGNRFGGSTLALAHLCDMMNSGRIIGIDISHKDVFPRVREHSRITMIEGDACSLYQNVRNLVSADERVLVIEDSSHTYENTLKVLNTYCGLVKPGDYFIVEDGICHHGLDVGPDPGPYEAIESFVARHPEFEIDRDRESFVLSWNPKGFLRRRA